MGAKDTASPGALLVLDVTWISWTEEEASSCRDTDSYLAEIHQLIKWVPHSTLQTVHSVLMLGNMGVHLYVQNLY